MIESIKPYMEHVKGNTYCIITGYCRFPLYKLNDTQAILIDSGLPRDWEGILECLQQRNLQVKAVLTTHLHPDHVGNHVNLRKTFGAKLYMTMHAAANCASAMNQVATYSGIITYRRICRDFTTIFAPDELIDWNAGSITVEGATFELLQLPGHSAEHLGIVTPDGVAYLGDAVLSAHVIKALRAPFTVCVELDLASKEFLAETKYDRYILAHNEVCDNVRELALLNRDLTLQRAEALRNLATEYVSLDVLTQRAMKQAGSELGNARRVAGFKRNIMPVVDYLIDMGKLTSRANDGVIEYIRTETTE